MTNTTEEHSFPGFEIDQTEIFAQFLLHNPREVLFYLDLLAQRRSILTAYIDEGRHFFLTSVLAIDETSGMLFLDPPNKSESNVSALEARQITLVTNLDRVKIQMRLQSLQTGTHQGQSVLLASIPKSILRLQRREFFRLEPPRETPLHCKLVAEPADSMKTAFELQLHDISGGGASLIAPTEIANHFLRDALFQQCRLEIPDEGVIQVNLRVRKTVEISDHKGDHTLRIGCEFVNMPGSRLAFIERYIARIERERKAKSSGLAD